MFINRLLDQLRSEERDLTLEIGRLESEGTGSNQPESGESTGEGGVLSDGDVTP